MICPRRLWKKAFGITDEGFLSEIEDRVVFPAEKLFHYCRDLIKPHNRLKIETLDRSYTDPREKLLHASFQILVDFVEKEKPFEYVDYEESGEDVAEAGEIIKELYEWWAIARPQRIDPYSKEFRGKKHLTKIPDDAEMLVGDDSFVIQDGVLKTDYTDVYRKHLDRAMQQEVLYDEEDKEMLVKLAEVYQYLWV